MPREIVGQTETFDDALKHEARNKARVAGLHLKQSYEKDPAYGRYGGWQIEVIDRKNKDAAPDAQWSAWANVSAVVPRRSADAGDKAVGTGHGGV